MSGLLDILGLPGSPGSPGSPGDFDGPLTVLAVGGALLTCLLAVAGTLLYASGRAQRRELVDRLSRTGPPGSRSAGPGRRFSAVDRRLRRTGLGVRIQRKLDSTGLDLTPGEFFVYVCAAVAVVWVATASLLAPFFGPVAGLVAVWGGNAFLSWQRQQRIEKFIGQLPDLARILANATQAGLALRTALGLAAEELDAPAGEELTWVANQLAVGGSIDDALGELAERLPSRELSVLVSTLVLANRAGGTVVESLRNLTTTLEERKETRREVRTMLAEVNATAYTIPVMGLGALLLMNSMASGSLTRVTGHPVGQLAVLVSLGLYAVGFVLIRRLGKIDI